ncbi:MAG: GCN5-related N-acetyltransferase [Parcubacteria group bacterium GW2011_GWA2_38_13]|nr:MAG: GCN5-related N-acetyltransferase [Parcubacteria group bacterium GW2011_GWA2_38_13]
MKVPIIKGKNVTLRPLVMSDAKNFCLWLADSEVTIFLQIHGEPSPTLSEEKRYIMSTKKDLSKRQFSIAVAGVHIGTLALSSISEKNKRAEFGIFIGDKKYWGQGCGTEAGKLLLHYAFQTLGLHRVYLSVIGYNIRAIKSYEKIGFRIEGRERQYFFREGHYHDKIIMGILKNEFTFKSKKYGKRK